MSQGCYSVMRFRLQSKPIRAGRFRPTNRPDPYHTQQTARRGRDERAARLGELPDRDHFEHEYDGGGGNARTPADAVTAAAEAVP